MIIQLSMWVNIHASGIYSQLMENKNQGMAQLPLWYKENPCALANHAFVWQWVSWWRTCIEGKRKQMDHDSCHSSMAQHDQLDCIFHLSLHGMSLIGKAPWSNLMIVCSYKGPSLAENLLVSHLFVSPYCTKQVQALLSLIELKQLFIFSTNYHLIKISQTALLQKH